MDEITVSIHDSEGNEIESPNCKCGQKADTCVIGKENYIWMCNKCLYGDQPVAKFVFKSIDGTSTPIRFPRYK